MEHVVFYPAADGAPAFRRVSSLDEAVGFVEHLRNVENVSDFSVYELSQVPLSFRAYYKAEIPGNAGELAEPVSAEDAAVDEEPAGDAVPVPALAPASSAPLAEVPPPAFPVEAVEPVAEPDGRRSLSFFSR